MTVRVDDGETTVRSTSAQPTAERSRRCRGPRVVARGLGATRQVTRWACVAGVVAACPTPYLITLASIGIPLGLILALDVRRLIGIHSALSPDAWSIVALVGGQLAALAGLLYLAAAGLSRFLLWAFAHKAITALVAAVMAGLLVGDGFDFLIVRSLEAAPPEHAWQKLSLLFTQ